MIEEIFQPFSDMALDPLRIVVAANGLRGARRGGNALDFAQYPRAAICDYLLDQLPLAIERGFIRTPDGRQYRGDEANDRHDRGYADRRDQAQARAVPMRPVILPGDSRPRRSRHASLFASFLFAATVRRKDCNSLAVKPEKPVPREREFLVKVNAR